MQSQKVIRCALVLATLSLGCAGGSISGGGGNEVSGIVTLDGEPLAYGVAQIQSLSNKSLSRRAVITAGKFTLAGPAGLPAGEYSVSMLPYEPEVEELNQIPADVRQKIDASRGLIPVKYQQPNALGLKVSGGAKNAFKFDLRKSEGPAS